MEYDIEYDVNPHVPIVVRPGHVLSIELRVTISPDGNTFVYSGMIENTEMFLFHVPVRARGLQFKTSFIKSPIK